jgi:hypothetical protein
MLMLPTNDVRDASEASRNHPVQGSWSAAGRQGQALRECQGDAGTAPRSESDRRGWIAGFTPVSKETEHRHGRR